MTRQTVRRLSLCLVLLVLASWAAGSAWRRFLHSCYPQGYSASVQKYCERYGVASDLIYAVIHTESGFSPKAVSPIGARGLMQITEETFEWSKWRMGEENVQFSDLFDSDTNIRYGTYILSVLLDEFGSAETALAAYHAGWGSVKRWLSDGDLSDDGQTLSHIPFEKTRQYVPRVVQVQSIYASLYR